MQFLATRNTMTYHGFEPKLLFSKNLVESSLSKAMVDFIFDELNLTITIHHFNKQGYGIDEYFWSSLQSTDAIGIPGGFTHKCLDEGVKSVSMARYA